MKNLRIIFFLFLFFGNFIYMNAQNYYDLQWKKIENNSKKGLYKSNLPIVLEIQKKADAEKNMVELIKSLRAEFSIVSETEDDTQNDAISQFFKKLKSFEDHLKGDSQLLYKVLLGDFFLDYYEMDSWSIGERTNLNSQDFSKIETWSELDFKNYLKSHFQELSNETESLRRIKIAEFKGLFDDTKNLEYFPSLLEYSSMAEIEFLNNADLFTRNELKQNQDRILAIDDRLIKENSENAQLFFAHQKIKHECDFRNCNNLLETLINLYNDQKFLGDYKVFVAEHIMNVYNEKNEYLKALEWGKKAENDYPKSKYLNSITNIENAIKSPSLSVHYETNTQSNKPILIVAQHKNVKDFSLNLYRVEDDYENFLKYVANPYSKEIFQATRKTLLKKEKYTLKNQGDYKTYTTNLEMGALPSGIYMVEYVIENAVQEHFYFIASQTKVLYQENNSSINKEDRYLLVDNENGSPLANEKLTFYELVPGKSIRKSNENTTKEGAFGFPVTSEQNYYRHYLIADSKNNFTVKNIYGNRTVREYSKPSGTAQIFTDRAIYRPGQTVYFKVVNTELKGEQESTVAGLRQEIKLFDANGEEVQKQDFTTNEFGSYHGNFVLPKGKLNGQFSLRVGEGIFNGQRSFRVEEYKRPTFEVTFEPITGEYKYGEKVEIKGKAISYSGVPISNAEVNFEIVKRNLRWFYFGGDHYGNQKENSILGTSKTNEKGEFSFIVELKKDENEKGIQVDQYEIEASISDINGETQSATERIKVASVSHYFDAEPIENAFTDENVQLKIETKNYNEQIVDKSFNLRLVKLQEPNRIIRDNFRSKIQNLSQYSKSEFIEKFPHDRFDKNDNIQYWAVEKTIKDEVVPAVTKNSKPAKASKSENVLDLEKLEAGVYRLELFNVEGKDTIRTKQTFQVWDKKKLSASQKPFLQVVKTKKEYQRGEKAKIFVYSAIPNANLNVFVQNGDGTTRHELFVMKKPVLEYEIAMPSEKEITELNIQFQIAAYNDVQTQSVSLKINDQKDDLKIETITFRDKIEPNSIQKWSIKITGNENEKVNAEVLANMYDLSLDQFASNTFSWRKLFNIPYFISSYGQSPDLSSEYFSKRIQILQKETIKNPRFDWFSHHVKVTAEVANYSIRSVERKSPVAKSMVQQDGAMEIREDIVGLDDNSIDDEIEKIPVRQNLNETAFFYPSLRTDENGDVLFEFTSPEALTKWKLMFLAHTKDARAATLEKEVITQKEFSIVPNYPRFLTSGDELKFQVKISNLTSQILNGNAHLEISDAITGEVITKAFQLSDTQKTFTVQGNANAVTEWTLRVPQNVESIIVKVVAKAGNFSDGEQKAIAVLPNRILVTDAVPIFVKEGQTKTFTLDHLKNTKSETIENVSHTLELTTNPIWEILFALPSLKYDHNNSSDVLFNKWFADVVAAKIFKDNPRLKSVFEEYQNKELLKSNLDKNQELKQLLLEETPWVLESNNEEEQMQKLARLFDANTMQNSINQDWKDLVNMQNPDGGFSWYQGYPSSYYTSLYILKNLGKIDDWLKDDLTSVQRSEQEQMAKKLIAFVDRDIERYYEISNTRKQNIWNNFVLDYLNTRHYWEARFPLKGKGATLKNLVIQQAPKADLKQFTFFGLHRAALLFDAYKLTNLSVKFITYLKETSTESETQGVYWKQNLNDWGWYSSKAVNHAGALEAFEKLSNDQSFVEEMKIWLVTQKEVNSWGSSRGTAEVIFNILNSGKSWTSNNADRVEVKWGGRSLQPQTEATGYVKQTVQPDKPSRDLAEVTIKKDGPGIVQGGLFWQYFEDVAKIPSSENYLSITRELYKKIKTENGEELQKITKDSPLQVGDRVTVRMILNSDRNMEFVHLKDRRAAGFEPVNVISGYRWNNGLGYYESTKDASTNFYIEYLPKGKYVFEYDYLCNAAGVFSNGIATLQNYYAPQMNAHTQGDTVTIEAKN